jgi:hypothetical protein
MVDSVLRTSDHRQPCNLNRYHTSRIYIRKHPPPRITPFLVFTTISAFKIHAASHYCPSVEFAATDEDGPDVCVSVFVALLPDEWDPSTLEIVVGEAVGADGAILPDGMDSSGGYSQSPCSSASNSSTWRRTCLPRRRKRILLLCTLQRTLGMVHHERSL